jgi:dienelactone hydrolase
MMSQDISFSAGTETLAGRLVLPSSGTPKAQALFLHGAGGAVKERGQPIAVELADAFDTSSFLFDFSGHGASSGTLQGSSLAKRVAEAKSALVASKFNGPVTVCGFSMGGHIALELLDHTNVNALALFYPAIYSRSVRDTQFGDSSFTEGIRKPESWRDSTALDPLRRFSGHLLVLIGEKDNVIPRGVIDLIVAAASQVKSSRVVSIRDAPHLLLPKLIEQPMLFQDVCKFIAQSPGDVSD